MFGLGKKKKEGATATVETKGEEKISKPAAETIEGLKVKVTEKQSCQVSLSVQIPSARVDEAMEDAYHAIQAKVKMPGFRPGKVPLEIVKKNFEGSAREEALDKTLRRTVFEVLQEQKIAAVATPVVDKIDFEPGKPLRFDMKVETSPEFTLADYKGLPLQKKVKTFADSDVDKKVDELREANARLVASEAAELSDAHFVVVDYEGAVDGKPLEGGKAKDQLIDMSAPQTIAGFTDGLRGGKAGDVRDVNVVFPADYHQKSLAGKAASFKVTIKEIKEKRLPEANDDFAKDVGCENLADLRDRIRKNLEFEFQKTVRQDLEGQISNALIDKNVFDLPPTLVKEQTEHYNERLKQYLKNQGATDEDFKANEEKLSSKNKTEAERFLRLSYVMSAIARDEKIDVTDADVDDVVKKSVESVDPARRGGMQKYMDARRESVRGQLMDEKVYTFLIDKAQVKEVPAEEAPEAAPAKSI